MPDEKPVSLAPLDLEKALTGLLAVKPKGKPVRPPRQPKGPAE